jgi:hypothetical protein
MLDHATFQAQVGAAETWVLADGRSIAGLGTKYENVTHTATIPNISGVFVRGKNNGRNDGYQNPDGELALDQTTSDKYKTHNHGGNSGTDSPDHSHGFGGYPFGASYGDDKQAQNLNTAPNGFFRITAGADHRHTHQISADGGNETAPKSVTLNPLLGSTNFPRIRPGARADEGACPTQRTSLSLRSQSVRA